MSISITNISEQKGIDYLRHKEEGKQYYGVFLNSYKLSEFEHNTEDGMYTCIFKAAQSIENVDIEAVVNTESKRRVQDLFDSIYKEN